MNRFWAFHNSKFSAFPDHFEIKTLQMANECWRVRVRVWVGESVLRCGCVCVSGWVFVCEGRCECLFISVSAWKLKRKRPEWNVFMCPRQFECVSDHICVSWGGGAAAGVVCTQEDEKAWELEYSVFMTIRQSLCPWVRETKKRTTQRSAFITSQLFPISLRKLFLKNF